MNDGIRYYDSSETRILKDGTVREYHKKKKYITKGYIHEDGCVYKCSAEQIAEMKEKYNAGGITQRKLAEEYGINITTLLRYLKM